MSQVDIKEMKKEEKTPEQVAAEAEKAAALAEKEKLKKMPKPMRATNGKTYKFLESSIVILIKRGWFSKPIQEEMNWGSIKKCDLEWGCCTGMLKLQLESGGDIIFRTGPFKAKKAAEFIQDTLNRRGDEGEDLSEHKEILSRLKGRTRVRKAGVSIEHTTCFGCRGEAHFVPWDAVVSAKLSVGCCGEQIVMKTMIHKKDESTQIIEAPARASKDHKSEKDKKEEVALHQGMPDVANYVSVTLRGKKGSMSEIFRIVTSLMAQGETDEEVEDAPQVRRARICKAGVSQGTASKMSFVPWTSITSVDYFTQFVGSAALVVTDRCGDQLKLKGVSHDGFLQFREIYFKASHLEDHVSKTKPIVRKNITLMPEGVMVTKKKCCSSETRTYPWSIIDAADLDMNCCGGKLVLSTEAGERIPVYKASCFSMGKLHEIWNRIRDMKYNLSDEKPGNPIWFAGKDHGPTSCLLTDKSIRLVSAKGRCGSQVRLVDLDSVSEVKSVRAKGCCAAHLLHVIFYSNLKVKSEAAMMAEAVDGDGIPMVPENAIMVKLKRKDNGPHLAREIMKRAKERQAVEP